MWGWMFPDMILCTPENFMTGTNGMWRSGWAIGLDKECSSGNQAWMWGLCTLDSTSYWFSSVRSEQNTGKMRGSLFPTSRRTYSVYVFNRFDQNNPLVNLHYPFVEAEINFWCVSVYFPPLQNRNVAYWWDSQQPKCELFSFIFFFLKISQPIQNVSDWAKLGRNCSLWFQPPQVVWVNLAGRVLYKSATKTESVPRI